MPIVLSLVNFVITVVTTICTVLYWLLVVRVILSWVGISPHTHYHEVLGILYQITDVVLRPFRKLPVTAAR